MRMVLAAEELFICGLPLVPGITETSDGCYNENHQSNHGGASVHWVRRIDSHSRIPNATRKCRYKVVPRPREHSN